MGPQGLTALGRSPFAGHPKRLIVYHKIKQFMLAEYKLTPCEYKYQFDSASKTGSITYIMFASWLRTLLNYCLHSRNVKDFEFLCALLVCDKVKACLSPRTIIYITSLEGNDWFKPEKVTTLADTFVANHNPRFGPSNSSAVKGVNFGKTGAEHSSFSGPSRQHEHNGLANPQFNKGKKEKLVGLPFRSLGLNVVSNATQHTISPIKVHVAKGEVTLGTLANQVVVRR